MDFFSGRPSGILSIAGFVHSQSGIQLLVATDTTGGNKSTLQKPFVGSGYTPSGAKKFRLLGIRVSFTATGTANGWKFGYADNDVGIDASTSLVNPVYLFKNVSTGTVVMNPAVSQSAPVEMGFPDGPGGAEMPNGKYFWFDNLGTNGIQAIQVYGREVD